MLERKLYMAGLGGNRYEISMENLKKMAYDAKIKKTDLVIVVETSDDGLAQEKTFRCDQIKGVAELFDQGVRDRELARELKWQQKEDAKNEKILQQQALERERAELHEVHLRESQARQEEAVALSFGGGYRSTNQQAGWALKRVKDFAKIIVAIVTGSALLQGIVFLFTIGRHLDGEDIFGLISRGLLLIVTLGGFLFTCLMFIVYLAQYHAETIKGGLLEASKDTKDEE
ncbi:MAG: hypothetical protein Q4Q42_05855 [Planctomycetia bacterium]|nr:hypothetical protein [Planctomycetia bacterium]